MAGTSKNELRAGLVNGTGTFIAGAFFTWLWGVAKSIFSPPDARSSAPVMTTVALPWWVIILAALVFLITAFWPSVRRLLHLKTSDDQTVSPELQQALDERDAARATASKLQDELNTRFPKLRGTILEFQPSDPVQGSNLTAVILVTVTNDGVDTSLRRITISAEAVNGAQIKTELAYPTFLPLFIDGGKSYLPYSDSHYLGLGNRVVVRRGFPVDGAVPCVFYGIKSPREINLKTLQIQFTDAIGRPDGGNLWNTPAGADIPCLEGFPKLTYVGFPNPLPAPPQAPQQLPAPKLRQ